ncbi:PrpF domain-containing protein, partial [Methylacidiphilum caldifontis]|uniref:PrpF domain-containing protein n=1 Tax=Methylacidiphilum caldifontis TaxID=2795386 RepID=UPI001FC9240D
MLSRSFRSDADVDYTFAQVAIDRPAVDYRPNCGNISAAVGPFAVQAGLVRPTEGRTIVRIFNTNTERYIEAEFLVEGGQFVADGDIAIPGVPGHGSPVYLTFIRPDGGATGSLFPTGNLVDRIMFSDGSAVDVSVVDAGNLTVIVDGSSLPDGWDAPWFSDDVDFSLGQWLERIRQEIGYQLNLYTPTTSIHPATHALPKITVVDSPRPYLSRAGQNILPEQITIIARAITMGKPHPAYPLTGGTALAACVKIPGTVANRLASLSPKPSGLVHIGHPSGVTPVDVSVSMVEGHWQVEATRSVRTARPL